MKGGVTALWWKPFGANEVPEFKLPPWNHWGCCKIVESDRTLLQTAADTLHEKSTGWLKGSNNWWVEAILNDDGRTMNSGDDNVPKYWIIILMITISFTCQECSCDCGTHYKNDCWRVTLFHLLLNCLSSKCNIKKNWMYRRAVVKNLLTLRCHVSVSHVISGALLSDIS